LIDEELLAQMHENTHAIIETCDRINRKLDEMIEFADDVQKTKGGNNV
jgi:hypothetical protein